MQNWKNWPLQIHYTLDNFHKKIIIPEGLDGRNKNMSKINAFNVNQKSYETRLLFYYKECPSNLNWKLHYEKQKLVKEKNKNTYMFRWYVHYKLVHTSVVLTASTCSLEYSLASISFLTLFETTWVRFFFIKNTRASRVFNF